MSIVTELILNEATTIDVGEHRLLNEEWSFVIKLDSNGTLVAEIDDTELDADDDVETLCEIYAVDKNHLSVVPEWLVDYSKEQILIENDPYVNVSSPLLKSIVVNGVEYFLYISYEAD